MKVLSSIVASALIAVSLESQPCQGHGFMSFPEPRNVLYKGGPFGPGDIQSLSAGGTQVERSMGHGLCGDRADRKAFMAPNAYGPVLGPVATFSEGQAIDIKVKITAHHWGWFEFRLCRPQDGGSDLTVPITQDCLNQHVLEFDVDYTKTQYQGKMRNGVSSPADYVGNPNNYIIEHVKCPYISSPEGSCCNKGGNCSPPNENRHRWVLPDPSKAGMEYTMRYVLPVGVTCDRCVLQWYYQTGNSPDSYPEGFWNCADIQITPSGSLTPVASPTPLSPVPNPTTLSPVPSPTTMLPVPTPTQPPNTPTSTPATGCHSIVSHISDLWCQQVNCDPVYADFCQPGPGGNPTPSPVTAAPKPTPSPVTAAPKPTPSPVTAVPKPTPSPVKGSGCHSKVSHISDEWCQGVKCDPVYSDFCTTGGSTPTPTTPAPAPTTIPPSASPVSIPTANPVAAPTQVPPPTASGGQKINIIGYYGNSGNALSYIPLLKDVPCFYNVIILTFANFKEDGSLEFLLQGPYSGNLEALKADILTWRSEADRFGRQRKVLFSIGGQNGHWPSGLTVKQIEDSINKFIDDFSLDGLDVDLEGSAVEQASTLETVIVDLRAQGKIVSAAPEAAQGPLTAYGSILPHLDYVHPQFYNNGPNAVTTPFTPAYQGSGWAAPPNHWQDKTPAGYASSSKPWWVNVLDTTSAYYGLSSSQRGMLIPATPDAAGNNNVWNIALLRDQVEAAGITHVGTWALAYDNKNSWAFAKAIASIMEPNPSC